MSKGQEAGEVRQADYTEHINQGKRFEFYSKLKEKHDGL